MFKVQVNWEGEWRDLKGYPSATLEIAQNRLKGYQSKFKTLSYRLIKA